MKLHKFLFFLLILFLPTQLSIHFWPSWAYIFGVRVDYLSPTIFVTDILVILIFTRVVKNISPRLILPFMVLLIFAVLNSLKAAAPLLAAYKWLKVLEFSFLIFYVNHYYPFIKKAFRFPLFISLILTSILGFLQVLHQGSLGGILYFIGERYFTISSPGIATSQINGQVFLRPYATLPHPNVLAGFLLVGFLLFIFSGMSKKYLILVFLLISPTFILTGSKSAVFALICLLFLSRLSQQFLFRATKLLLIFSIIISLISPLVLINIFPQLNNLPQFASSRIALSLNALEITSQHPGGVGLGNFILHSHDKLPPFLSIFRFQPAHNAFLLLFTELGLILFGVLTILIFLALRNNSVALLLCLATIIITSLFDHYWITQQQSLLLASIVVGLVSAKILKVMNCLDIYTDGGARGNPGPSACAFIIYENQTLLYKGGKYIGHATNNQAEYQGVLEALKFLIEKYPGKCLRFFLDSELVVKQLTGVYKIKNSAINANVVKIRELMQQFESVTFTHVPRSKNAVADNMVNVILDENNSG